MKELSAQGLPGYCVDEKGSVFDQDGKRLRFMVSSDGYNVLRIKYYKEVKIKYKNYHVNKLMAIAYLPNPFHHEKIRMIDGDPQNCVLSNMEWKISKKLSRAEYIWVSDTWETDYPYAHVLAEYILS